MTLKEQFDNVEIMFENQVGSLKYDELSEASNQCEQVADEFAIGFLDWIVSEDTKILLNDLAIVGEVDESTTSKELLKIYKQEKEL